MSDLLDIEHELNYQYERKKAKKEHLIASYNQEARYHSKEKERNMSPMDPEKAFHSKLSKEK